MRYLILMRSLMLTLVYFAVATLDVVSISLPPYSALNAIILLILAGAMFTLGFAEQRKE